MKRYLFFVIAVIVLVSSFPSHAKSEDFTQKDRERLIRTEIKIEEGQKALQRQVNDLKSLILWGFGILFGGMGLLIGFVIWDRRTALEPESNGVTS